MQFKDKNSDIVYNLCVAGKEKHQIYYICPKQYTYLMKIKQCTHYI